MEYFLTPTNYLTHGATTSVYLQNPNLHFPPPPPKGISADAKVLHSYPDCHMLPYVCSQDDQVRGWGNVVGRVHWGRERGRGGGEVEVVRGILASFDGAFWGYLDEEVQYKCEFLACGNGTFESEFSMRPIPVQYTQVICNENF